MALQEAPWGRLPARAIPPVDTQAFKRIRCPDFRELLIVGHLDGVNAMLETEVVKAPAVELDLHTLTMLVENEPGVTARVTSLFAGRGFNIETICGAPTANPRMSRITVTTRSTPAQLENLLKQLRRLVNVIKVRVMAGDEAVRREMALICVRAAPENRQEIRALVETFRARIVDTAPAHYIIETTGRREKVEAFIRLLEPMGIKKLSRSGILALYRESD